MVVWLQHNQQTWLFLFIQIRFQYNRITPRALRGTTSHWGAKEQAGEGGGVTRD